MNGDLITPTAVKAETTDWVSDGDGTLLGALEEKFTLTHQFTHFTPTKDVLTHLTSKGLKMSSKKMGMEIRKLIRTTEWDGEQRDKLYEVQSGNKTVYHGIRVKTMEDD